MRCESAEERSFPLEKQKFGAEAGTERCGKRDVVFLKRSLFEPFLQDKKNRGAGKISDGAQNIPRGLRVAFAEAEFLLDVAQQTRATGMQNPTANRVARLAVTRQETINKSFDFCANHFRHIFRKKDVKAGILQIEPHCAKGIREGVGLRREDARSSSAFIAADDHRSRTITKQNRGNQICLRNI